LELNRDPSCEAQARKDATWHLVLETWHLLKNIDFNLTTEEYSGESYKKDFKVQIKKQARGKHEVKTAFKPYRVPELPSEKAASQGMLQLRFLRRQGCP